MSLCPPRGDLVCCIKRGASGQTVHTANRSVEERSFCALGGFIKRDRALWRLDVTIREAYSVLGLEASSTADEVRLRFRELIRSNHPDGKPSYEQARANETTRAIVEACIVLRTQGFPRVVAGSRDTSASGLRCRQQTPAEPHSADIFVWFDELWRECVSSNLVCVVSPAFGVRLTLGAWATVWEIMWGGQSFDRPKRNWGD